MKDILKLNEKRKQLENKFEDISKEIENNEELETNARLDNKSTTKYENAIYRLENKQYDVQEKIELLEKEIKKYTLNFNRNLQKQFDYFYDDKDKSIAIINELKIQLCKKENKIYVFNNTNEKENFCFQIKPNNNRVLQKDLREIYHIAKYSQYDTNKETIQALKKQLSKIIIVKDDLFTRDNKYKGAKSILDEINFTKNRSSIDNNFAFVSEKYSIPLDWIENNLYLKEISLKLEKLELHRTYSLRDYVNKFGAINEDTRSHLEFYQNILNDKFNNFKNLTSENINNYDNLIKFSLLNKEEQKLNHYDTVNEKNEIKKINKRIDEIIIKHDEALKDDVAINMYKKISFREIKSFFKMAKKNNVDSILDNERLNVNLEKIPDTSHLIDTPSQKNKQKFKAH